MKRRAFAIASKTKRLFHRSLLENGNPANLRLRAFSVSSYDYREKLSRNGIRDINLDEAIHLFSEMFKSRPYPYIIDFNKLLSAIAKMKKFDIVISLGEKMQNLGIKHDLFTYSIFINCFCRSSQLSLALIQVMELETTTCMFVRPHAEEMIRSEVSKFRDLLSFGKAA